MARLDLISNSTSAAVTPGTLPRTDLSGLYVHIPFCFHKCHYCDFYSITRQTPLRMSHFVELTLRELDYWIDANVQTIKPKTIFFGGGTPSLLPIDAMDALLTGLRSRMDLSSLTEWTIEVNPATADLDYLRMLRSHGVDRISMGAQSFDPIELQTLERHHDPADVVRSVELCRTARFERLNIDLIYAIPDQTLESWHQSLARAMELNLTHYSCYNLTYEPNTPMAVKQRLGRIREVEESLELQMLRDARSMLGTFGCAAYEVSNYAAPGQECQHNLLYWRGGSYLGIGPSAASHLDGVRFKNRPHLGEWESAIQRGELPAIEIECLTPEQREGEYVMLGLRLAEGVSDFDFRQKFGRSLRDRFPEQLDSLCTLGLIEMGQRLRLTDKGLAFADAVAAEFL